MQIADCRLRIAECADRREKSGATSPLYSAASIESSLRATACRGRASVPALRCGCKHRESHDGKREDIAYLKVARRTFRVEENTTAGRHRGTALTVRNAVTHSLRLTAIALVALLFADSALGQDEAKEKKKGPPPKPPSELKAVDHPLDGGDNIDITFKLSPDDTAADEHKKVVRYVVQIAGEKNGQFEDKAQFVPDKKAWAAGVANVTVDKLVRGEQYFFRVKAIGPGGVESPFIETTEAVIPTRQPFDGGRAWMLVITLLICGSVVIFILSARKGKDLKIRKIAGLEAVDEAVGRATEMGRPILFVPGIQDMNEIQTIAGLTVLSRVAQVAAEYGAKVEVPTSRSLVMTTARETVQSSFLQAGRPDAYNEDDIYYVTDEQFGYVAYLSGMMVREKPAACFYMGAFFAESLILAETGNSIGAIQVAGTAMPSQLPFFVAACDYTLIGEEFFAASAYLSGDPDQLGSLKGQDVGKLIVAGLMIIGCVLLTGAALTGVEGFQSAADFLRNTILRSG